ncbi:MAG TPA: hypothetical protein VFJ62_16450 [Usitatibacter sp.]|nr:hypothetical protein [Usitatibacter sp.]
MTVAPRVAWAAAAAGVALGAAVAWHIPQQLVDEMHYGPQVQAFMEGRFTLDPAITMLPTYHAIVAAIARMFGGYSDRLARAVSLAGSVLVFPLALRLADAPDRGVRALQCLFVPLLFPYLFLIYTDAWSLAAFGALVLCTVRRRFAAAALAGAFGTLLRQDFIVWVVMAWAMAVWRDGITPPSVREAASNALRAWPFALVVAGFAVFVAWNGAVAMGDRSRHEHGVNVTNVYLMLAYGWFAFLPFNAKVAPRLVGMLRRPWCALAVGGAFAAYMATFSNPHEYNRLLTHYFIHNAALAMLADSWALRAVAFVPIAWMALAAVSACVDRPQLRVPLAFATAAAALHPLVEPRYYLPAFFLFILWRPAATPRAEIALTGAYLATSLALLQAVASTLLFP